jgi:peptidoglycan/LPS O-acetylase OafA/YrhL
LLAFGLLAVAVFVPFGLTALMPIAGSYLLFAAAFSPALRVHGWARPGDFSYGIYLYAFPIQQLIVQRLGAIHPLALFALATPAAVLFGAASWHGVERWFLRRTRKPSPPAPVAAESAPATS